MTAGRSRRDFEICFRVIRVFRGYPEWPAVDVRSIGLREFQPSNTARTNSRLRWWFSTTERVILVPLSKASSTV